MDNENVHIETSWGSSGYPGLVGQKGSASAPKPDVVCDLYAEHERPHSSQDTGLARKD